MEKDNELLACLDENVNMGLEALKTLEFKLKSTDNKIKSNVEKAYKEYQKFAIRLEKMSIEKKPPKKTNLISLIMSKMGTNIEFMKDNSDSKIAELLIQGYNMGLIDITKKLKKYEGDCNKETVEIAKDYEKMIQIAIEDVKGFL